MLRSILLLLLIVVIASCASAPVTSPNVGRYSISQDRAPDTRVDVANIPDVIPEPFTRTMAGNRSPYSVLGQTYHVMDSEVGYSERGVASWYGEKFHGHKTSNGEIFDMYKSSAAHKSLPIPSYLRVTNLDNNRSIIVRVNDRGPFHGNRIVDLSYAAALKLGYADRGTARVQLDAVLPDGDTAMPQRADTILPAPTGAAEETQFLQVGAFSSLSSARAIQAELQQLTEHPVFIRSVDVPRAGLVHRVRVGPLYDAHDVRTLSQRVVAANLGSPYTVTE